MWLELLAAVLSAFGVWLTAKRRPLAWPVGLVSVVLYGWVFIDARLYSDALLQGIYVILLFYGWWRWMQHLDAGGKVEVAHLHWRLAVLHIGIGVVTALWLGYSMANWTNAALPWLDASLTAFSLVAQWWQAKRHIAAWGLWIVVDCIYIGEYLYKGLTITSLLYAGFIALAIYGLIAWRRAERGEDVWV